MRTARVVCCLSVFACAIYSPLFDSYILVQVESEKIIASFSHSIPDIATDSNPVASFPIGIPVTNIIYIPNLSYRIWCLASPAIHSKLGWTMPGAGAAASASAASGSGQGAVERQQDVEGQNQRALAEGNKLSLDVPQNPRRSKLKNHLEIVDRHGHRRLHCGRGA